MFYSILQCFEENLNSSAGKRLHYLEGFYRIIAGSIAGFIISAAIKTGILIPIFSKVDKTNIAMILAGLLAGSSERWAPSLISKFENNENNLGKNNTNNSMED